MVARGVWAMNSVGETCMASPAISDDNLFFRTGEQLAAMDE